VLIFEDCLGRCQLSEEEIQAIAEHELMRAPHGEALVSPMLIDDVRAAERQGERVHAAQWKRCLRHVIEQHRARRASGQDRPA